MIESGLLSIRIFLVQVTVKIGEEKYLSLVLFWTYKIKDLIGKKMIGSFHEKELCWLNYKWVVIQNQTVILEIKSK